MSSILTIKLKVFISFQPHLPQSPSVMNKPPLVVGADPDSTGGAGGGGYYGRGGRGGRNKGNPVYQVSYHLFGKYKYDIKI